MYNYWGTDRDAGVAVGARGSKKVEGNAELTKNNKFVTNYVCFCSLTMLTSKIITEIIENHTEFSVCVNSCYKFVASRSNYGIIYNTVRKRHLRPLCLPFEKAGEKCLRSPASQETEQIRACVSRYDQSPWTANWWRNSKFCAFCKHRCAAVEVHTEGCHIKKHNEKLVMHQNSQLNQASWIRTVLKFSSKNQFNVHNDFSILFSVFSLDRTIW